MRKEKLQCYVDGQFFFRTSITLSYTAMKHVLRNLFQVFQNSHFTIRRLLRPFWLCHTMRFLSRRSIFCTSQENEENDDRYGSFVQENDLHVHMAETFLDWSLVTSIVRIESSIMNSVNDIENLLMLVQVRQRIQLTCSKSRNMWTTWKSFSQKAQRSTQSLVTVLKKLLETDREVVRLTQDKVKYFLANDTREGKKTVYLSTVKLSRLFLQDLSQFQHEIKNEAIRKSSAISYSPCNTTSYHPEEEST